MPNPFQFDNPFLKALQALQQQAQPPVGAGPGTDNSRLMAPAYPAQRAGYPDTGNGVPAQFAPLTSGADFKLPGARANQQILDYRAFMQRPEIQKIFADYFGRAPVAPPRGVGPGTDNSLTPAGWESEIAQHWFGGAQRDIPLRKRDY